MNKEIRAFEKKHVMNMEEIKNNVRNLTRITASLEAAVTEQEVKDVFDRINMRMVIACRMIVIPLMFYRVSTMSSICWRWNRDRTLCSKL